MYCVKCGVELAASEAKCPLCGTNINYRDDDVKEYRKKPYPPYPGEVYERVSRSGVLFVLTVLFLLPIVLCLIVDLKINGGLIWSGYASGAFLFLYIVTVLPIWFDKPNPVIFVPVDFVALGAFLLYINYAVGGDWFLSLAFPVVGICGLIITAVVALMRYTKGGELYIFGGATILFGFLMVLVEFFTLITFGIGRMFVWSLYPLVALFIIGMALIVIGACRPIRESLHKKFFF